MKTLAGLLAVSLCLLAPATAFAGESVDKNETVFATLEADGTVKSMNAVNSFEVTGNEIIDYANYRDIKNLTDGASYSVDGDTITWKDAGQDKPYFYYQGSLSSFDALPWMLDITYLLDGTQVKPAQLAGQSGRVEVRIQATAQQTASEYFAQSMLMQLSVPVDMSCCYDIQAEDATSVIAGNTQTLAFNILPGEDRAFSITMQAKEFRMDGMQANIIPYDVSSIGDFEQFTTGIDDMIAGMDSMSSGTRQLQSGMRDLAQGTDKLKSGSGKLNTAGSKISSGMDAYAGGLKTFEDEAGQLKAGSKQLLDELSNMSDAPKLARGYESMESGLADMLQNKGALKQLAQGMLQNPDPQVVTLAQALLGYIDGTETVYGNIQAMNPKLRVLADGAGRLGSEYGKIHSGISATVDGIGTLQDSFGKLQSGVDEALKGIQDLDSGLGTMNSSVQDIPDEISKLIEGQFEMRDGIQASKDKLDEVLPQTSDAKPESFSMPGVKVKSIQFVLKTPGIETPEEQTTDVEPPAETKSFLQKLKELF